jgi:hypothetical protein
MAEGDGFDVKRRRVGFGPVADYQSEFVAVVGGNWYTFANFSISDGASDAALVRLLHTRVLKCLQHGNRTND